MVSEAKSNRRNSVSSDFHQSHTHIPQALCPAVGRHERCWSTGIFSCRISAVKQCKPLQGSQSKKSLISPGSLQTNHCPNSLRTLGTILDFHITEAVFCFLFFFLNRLHLVFSNHLFRNQMKHSFLCLKC